MKILITGAFGYLGSALLERLGGTGHEVTAFGHRAVTPVALPLPENVVAIEGDVCDANALNSLETEHDAVVHLAGGGGPHANPLALARANGAGTALVAEYAASCRARAVYASSIYVYPAREQWSAPRCSWHGSFGGDPDTLYGAIKESGELLWAALARWRGSAVLRFGHIYGPSPLCAKRREDVVSCFVRAAARREPVPLFGNGRRLLDLVHVRDACEAIVAAIEDAAPDVANVSGGAPVTVADLAARIAAIGGVAVESRPGPGDDETRRSMSIDAARFSWRPRISLDDGLREFYNSERAAVVTAAAAPQP